MTEKLFDKREISTEDSTIQLEYYLIEENLNDSSDIKMYGVRIVMTEIFDGKDSVRSDKWVHSMFSNSKQIEDFINLLIRNEVTPTTLECIAKEYIVDLLYVE